MASALTAPAAPQAAPMGAFAQYVSERRSALASSMTANEGLIPSVAPVRRMREGRVRASSARPATVQKRSFQPPSSFGAPHLPPPFWPPHTGYARPPPLQFPRPKSAVATRTGNNMAEPTTRAPLAVQASAVIGAAKRLAASADPEKTLKANPAMAQHILELADGIRGTTAPKRPASASPSLSAMKSPTSTMSPASPAVRPPRPPSASAASPAPPLPPSGNLAMPPPPPKPAAPTIEELVRGVKPRRPDAMTAVDAARKHQSVAESVQVVRPPSRGERPSSRSGRPPSRNERGQHEPPPPKPSMRWVREEEKEMAPGERPNITEPDGSFKVMVPSAYDRWRMSLKDKRGNQLSQEDVDTIAFNGLITALKDRIYQKGPFAITNHFQVLDVDGSGSLEPDEFFAALSAMNLGPGLNKKVSDLLLEKVDKDGSGSLDYVEFTDAIRMGRVDYVKPQGRHRCGPDPDAPFGEIGHRTPWGIMADAGRNLDVFDKKINSMFRDLGEVFERFDTDGSGEIDFNEFGAAMREMNRKKGLNLSEEEIARLFKVADDDRSGAISYAEFVKGFSGAGGRRFIPEFLKPKGIRSSMAGPIWDHRQPHPFTNPSMFERSTARYRGSNLGLGVSEYEPPQPPNF